MPIAKPRILIADHHELIREGWKRILERRRLVGHLREAGTASAALQAAREASWNLVILELNLPGRGGLEVLKEIKALHSAPAVLVLSARPEEQFAVRAMRAGADACITKSAPACVLFEAVQRLLAGEKYISPAVAAQLAEAVAAPHAAPPHAALSDREEHVFRGIAGGQTVGEIAAAIRLSVKTVSTYRANVLRKLGLRNNAQLMRYAHEHRLVE